MKNKSELVETGERNIIRPRLHLTASLAASTKIGSGGEFRLNDLRSGSLLRWKLYRQNPPTDDSMAAD